MKHLRVVYTFRNGSVESLARDEEQRRIRELMGTLKKMLTEAARNEQIGAARSAGRLAEEPTELQKAVIEAIKNLPDSATNAEIRTWCRKKRLITPNVDSWDIGRVRASLLKKYSPRT